MVILVEYLGIEYRRIATQEMRLQRCMNRKCGAVEMTKMQFCKGAINVHLNKSACQKWGI